MQEFAAAELEALQCIYTDEELEVVRADPLEIAVRIDPEITSETDWRFVHADLILRTEDSYPESTAKCQLQNVKGLNDEKRKGLQTLLDKEAGEMIGEMVLGHLCNLAKDFLTERNQPEGSCAFCLEQLAEQEASCRDKKDEANGLLVLSCYHCYHRSCFARWYSAEQRDKQLQREETLKAYKHSATPEFLERMGLKLHIDNLFAVACPICRVQILPDQFQERDRAFLSRGDSNPISESREGWGLAASDLEALRAMQIRHRSLFELQLAKGGIVSERYAVALT